MDEPEKRFDETLKKLGLDRLPCDLMHRALSCIHIPIGGDEKIYLGDHRKPNGVYVERAVERALQLYALLPSPPDLIRMDLEDGTRCQKADLSPEQLRKLFREIVRAEIDPAGHDILVGNVYFLDTRNQILFQLYDDRDAYVAAADPAMLESLINFKNALLIHDK